MAHSLPMTAPGGGGTALRSLDVSPWAPRVEEAVSVLRYKDVRSTTIERIRHTWQADALVRDLPQPLQLGEGLYYLLDNIAVPVSEHDLIVGRILEEVPDGEGEAFLATVATAWNGRSLPSWMHDGGHECFAWEPLVRLGLSGLEDRAVRRLEQGISSGEDEESLDFLRGAVRIYQALRNYARRYAAAARAAGLDEAAEACEAAFQRPPETFVEGLQLIWLVGNVYCTMVAGNPTLTFGRMDELLLDLYESDVASGRLDRVRAGDLIEDFYCKHNLILGRGEHQMSGNSDKATGWFRNLTYDAPQYVVVGGTRKDGSASCNELTELFIERVVPRFENPVIVVRYTKDLPADTWVSICDRLRANASMMVYNDHNIIPAMVHSGTEEEDAVTYTMHGCNWPDIPGRQREIIGHQAILPTHLLDGLRDESSEIGCIDDLYERFSKLFSAEMEAACDRLRQYHRERLASGPGVLRIDDCFMEGPIDQARSWLHGAVKYYNAICAISSLATAADCFAAVDELVFVTGKVSLAELREALRNDFAGCEPLRRLCLNAPKFGQDDDRADRHAVRVLNTVLEVIDQASRFGSDDEVCVFRCLETDMRHIGIGAGIGATPDGRHAGQPTSENTSPYPGSCKNGITAMLRSVARLPLNRINSGALNVRLSPRLVEGPEGLARLASLFRTYLDTGGLQVQLSIADSTELRDAQLKPDQYRDLMVRITGYSAVFIDMDKNAQDEIIRREEMA